MLDRVRFISFVLLTLLMAGCTKNSQSDWNYCEDCSASQWAGNYSGTGDYYNGSSNMQYLDVSTTVMVTSTSEDGLKIEVSLPDYYQISFTTVKDNNDFFINVPGSSNSLALTLTQNGKDNRLTGTAKSYHYKADTLIVDHSASFEVIAKID